MLNRSKGPAVWSPRAQCDRGKFIWEWRTILDHTDNLDIFQDQADELLVEYGKVLGIKTIWGIDIYARTVVITAGTFLNGLMHIGKRRWRVDDVQSLLFTTLRRALHAMGFVLIA